MKAVSETERSAFTKHVCVWPLSEQTRQGLLSQTQLLRAQMRASCPLQSLVAQQPDELLRRIWFVPCVWLGQSHFQNSRGILCRARHNKALSGAVPLTSRSQGQRCISKFVICRQTGCSRTCVRKECVALAATAVQSPSRPPITHVHPLPYEH